MSWFAMKERGAHINVRNVYTSLRRVTMVLLWAEVYVADRQAFAEPLSVQ
jgi:hypothetical protein